LHNSQEWGTRHPKFNYKARATRPAQTIRDELERDKILSHIADLESTKGSKGFLSAYQTFMGVIADHITVFAPFFPILALMLSGH
jgi:hypothetical protein